jgi:Domain of unknown function (DUF4340)
MNRQRLVALIVIALLALGGASFLAGRRDGSQQRTGASLFPTLAAQANSASEMTVFKGSSTPSLTVHKQNEQWTVAERANYPADISKLRGLLQSLADAKIIEEKTSNPASYPVIGVEDPLKPEAGGAEVSISVADGKHAVIVGKSSPEGSYVRRAGEEKSYSVAPAISVDAEPRFWIDTKLLDLKTADIQKVDMKFSGAPSYMIHRAATPAPAAPAAATPPAPASPAAAPATPPAPASPPSPPPPPPPPPPADFILDGVPAGRKAGDAQTLAPSPTSYGSLSIDDVAQADGIDFSKASVATLTLANGNVVSITGTVIGEKHWVKVSATQDAALTAKATGRAYEISNFRYDAIFRPLEQLLVPKPAPEDKNAKSPVGPPPPAKLPGAKQPRAQSSPTP